MSYRSKLEILNSDIQSNSNMSTINEIPEVLDYIFKNVYLKVSVMRLPQ